MKKPVLFAISLLIAGQAYAAPEHTRIVSALSMLKDQYSSAKQYIIKDADGADVSTVCINLVLNSWSLPVLKTVATANDTSIEVKTFNKFLKLTKQYNQEFEKARPGIQKETQKVIQQAMTNGEWPKTPENLTFDSAPQYTSAYFEALTSCSSSELAEQVSQQLPAMDLEAMITPTIILEEGREALGIAGGGGTPDVIYEKTMTYREWIKAVLEDRIRK